MHTEVSTGLDNDTSPVPAYVELLQRDPAAREAFTSAVISVGILEQVSHLQVE